MQQHHGLFSDTWQNLVLGQAQVAEASSALRETSDRADVMAAHLKHVQARTWPEVVQAYGNSGDTDLAVSTQHHDICDIVVWGCSYVL